MRPSSLRTGLSRVCCCDPFNSPWWCPAYSISFLLLKGAGLLLGPCRAVLWWVIMVPIKWVPRDLRVLSPSMLAGLSQELLLVRTNIAAFTIQNHPAIPVTAVLIELQLPAPERRQGMDTFCLGLLLVFSGLQRSLAWKLSPLCIWVLLNEMQCKRQSITLELEALPPFQDWFLFHKLLLHGLMISLHANALGCYPGALTFHRTKNSSSSMLLWPKHFSSKHGILNTQASLPCHYQWERNWIQRLQACLWTCHLL